MAKVLFSVEEVREKIRRGERLILAGDERVLSQLPEGDWIAGTIPYFMAEDGGEFSREKIHVTRLPDFVDDAVVRTYDEENIKEIYTHIPPNGFVLLIIPASSRVHLSFAMNAPNYKEFAGRPLIGWISGVFLEELGKTTPKVVSGREGKVFEDIAVAMHVSLPPEKSVDIGIVNIFRPGDGDVLTFPETGFCSETVMVNGEKTNFAEYLKAKNADTRLPLVADYCGATINISFQRIDEDAKVVHFYAPVFEGVVYRHAAPVSDYVKEFTSHLPEEDLASVFFSCNCILNYLYSELEGKRTGGITGPITFGEIAYQLLNQTMAYLQIVDA